MRIYDPEGIIAVTHDLIGGLSYRLNRANGYLDRLDAALAAGHEIGAASVAALQLAADAKALRKLAAALDERREALTGTAPRLRLVAAE